MTIGLSNATVNAQQKTKFAIASFGQDPFDTTPTNPQYEKVDGNGARYAIIKVTSTNPEDDLRAYRFNFGNLNSLVEEHDGQLWVYVQRNAKLVTISREGFQTIDKHDLGLTIEAGKTYIMQLASAGITVSRQTVMFNVSPPDANATIVIKSDKPGAREEEFGTTNASGMVGKTLELGTYTYRVVANDYQPTEGRITLKDKSDVHIEPVKLQDILYPLTITSKPKQSKVYLNGEYLGKTPYTGEYSKGDYEFEVRHPYNKLNKQTIHIPTDSAELFVELQKNYVKRYSGYIQGFFGAGMKYNKNLGVGAGVYLHNFNLEFDASFYSCFSNTYYPFPSYAYQKKGYYKPCYAILVKLGYGFILGKYYRITPQIGTSWLRCKAKNPNYYYKEYVNEEFYTTLSIGGRIEIIPARHFGLFLSLNTHINLNKLWYECNFDKEFRRFDLKLGMFISF